jgi:hypothetical protein
MRPANWIHFRNLDYLALTSLARFSDTDPYQNCRMIGTTMCDALRNGGNVLFPINPIGYIFDLLEVIFGAIEEVCIDSTLAINYSFSIGFLVMCLFTSFLRLPQILWLLSIFSPNGLPKTKRIECMRPKSRFHSMR